MKNGKLDSWIHDPNPIIYGLDLKTNGRVRGREGR